MKLYLFLLFSVLFSGAATAQNLTIEGHLFNLADEPVVNAVLTLNTPSELQTISDSSGFYQFNISEYPTAVYPFLNDDSKLQPGKIRLEIYEVSGRKIAAHEAELLLGGQISGLNTWQNPESGKLYIARVTDKNNRVFSRKFIYSTLQDFANGIFLKSAETGDTYHYEITIQPETENPAFAVVTLPVEGFSKTETSFTQDFMVNEFIQLNGELKDLYFGINPVTVDVTGLFTNDNDIMYSSACGNVSFSVKDEGIMMTYTPDGSAAEDITLIATDADDASITHEADFRAVKGKILTGHARELEWGKALDSVLAVAFDGQNVYHAYSNNDGDFNIIVPKETEKVDVYMEKDGFRTTSNKYKVKDQDVTVFKRNNMYPVEFTKIENFMPIFEDMCHRPDYNGGLSANFLPDDDDSTKVPIYINKMTDYLTWNSSVKPEWVQATIDGIWKDSLMFDEKISKNRFEIIEINSVDEVDRSKPFVHIYYDDDDNSGISRKIDKSTGYINNVSISLTPGINPDLNAQIRNIKKDGNTEFESSYIQNYFDGSKFPNGTNTPDNQSYYGYNGGSITKTPLDTMLNLARGDELHGVNPEGNHPNLNYPKIQGPLKNRISNAALYATKEEE